MISFASAVRGGRHAAPNLLTTLFAITATVTVLTIAVLALLLARDTGDQIGQTRIDAAEERMARLSAAAAGLDRGAPEVFVQQMMATGEFASVGLHLTQADLQIEAGPNGQSELRAPHGLALRAISAGRQVAAVENGVIALSRPIFGQTGQIEGAVYMTLRAPGSAEVFGALMRELAGPFLSALAAFALLAVVLAPKTLRRFTARVSALAAGLKAELAEINALAFTDPLTRLPNRADFLRRGAATVEQSSRVEGAFVGLVFIDLDGFKAINDGYGPDMGDRLLAHFAEEMQHALRATDTVFADDARIRVQASIPARLGGDQFTVLLPGLATPEAADVVAGRLLQLVARPLEIGGEVLKVGASIGVSVDLAVDAAFDRLLSEADAAMCEVKRTGKNNFMRVGFGRASP